MASFPASNQRQAISTLASRSFIPAARNVSSGITSAISASSKSNYNMSTGGHRTLWYDPREGEVEEGARWQASVPGKTSLGRIPTGTIF
jgi:hypothetical protein